MASKSNISELSEIRSEFAKYKGGSVDFLKDENSGIATVRLNYPDRRNALSGEMMVKLADIVDELERWTSGKGLILCSAGDFFCSGGDLTLVKHICNAEGGLRMSTLMHNVLTRLSMLPLVSTALVQGKAIGGGAELLTACDFRLLTPSAEIQFVQLKMGVATGWGGGTRLVKLLGASSALKLLTSCQKVSAKYAYDCGLATAVLESDENPLEQAHSWLAKCIEGAPEVVRTIKSIVVNASNCSMTDSLKAERELFSSVWGGPANLAALQQNIKHK